MDRKIAKKDRKLALLSLFQGEGATEIKLKNSKKRPKNSTIKGVLNPNFRPFSFKLRKN